MWVRAVQTEVPTVTPLAYADDTGGYAAGAAAQRDLHSSVPLLRAGADQPGGGMRRDEEKTMSLEEAKRDLWRLKPAL